MRALLAETWLAWSLQIETAAAAAILDRLMLLPGEPGFITRLIARCESPMERLFVTALLMEASGHSPRAGGAVRLTFPCGLETLLRAQFALPCGARADFALLLEHAALVVEIDGHDVVHSSKWSSSSSRNARKASPPIDRARRDV
jgi:hypothetical protein